MTTETTPVNPSIDAAPAECVKPTPATGEPVGALGSMLSRFIKPKLTAANFPLVPTTIQ